MKEKEFDIKMMIEGLKKLYQKYEKLRKEISEMEDELQRILTKHGWTEDYVKEHVIYINKRWVKNKIGQKYYYFWLVVKHRGEVIENVYLGSTVRKELEEEVNDFRRAKELLIKIEDLKYYFDRCRKRLREIEDILIFEEVYP